MADSYFTWLQNQGIDPDTPMASKQSTKDAYQQYLNTQNTNTGTTAPTNTNTAGGTTSTSDGSNTAGGGTTSGGTSGGTTSGGTTSGGTTSGTTSGGTTTTASGDVSSSQSTTITNEMNQDVTNPDLPPGTEVQYEDQVATPDTFEENVTVNPDQYAQDAVQGNYQGAAEADQPDTSTYDASTVTGSEAQMTAAQGTVSDEAVIEAAQGTYTDETMAAFDNAAQGEVTANSTVQGQLTLLQAQFADGEVPPWAAEFYRNANFEMAARGMGASTMAAQALFQAAMESSLPIAMADAQVYERMNLQNLNNRQQMAVARADALSRLDLTNLNNRQQAAVENARNFLQMDLANLNNQQQAALANMQARNQFLLSDQAAINAAKQFNATSENQANQFFANLNGQIRVANAELYNDMQQFNAGQTNAMNQFNASLGDLRERFNVENELAIQQSNVAWRRSINTYNTEMQNRANELNALNLLSISNTAMANMWQAVRDNVDHAWVSGENAKDREHNLAMEILRQDFQRELLDLDGDTDFWDQLGEFAFNFFGSYL